MQGVTNTNLGITYDPAWKHSYSCVLHEPVKDLTRVSARNANKNITTVPHLDCVVVW